MGTMELQAKIFVIEQNRSMQLNKQLVRTGQQCPYCGKQTHLVHATTIYGEGCPDYGWFYYCPDDQAWVGIHKNKAEALGRLANKELRGLKGYAHQAFDKLWNVPKCDKSARRTLAYRWLAIQMHLSVEETHIGMFDEEQCKAVCFICSNPQSFHDYLKQQV